MEDVCVFLSVSRLRFSKAHPQHSKKIIVHYRANHTNNDKKAKKEKPPKGIDEEAVLPPVRVRVCPNRLSSLSWGSTSLTPSSVSS